MLTRGSCILVPREPSFLVTWSLQIKPGGSGDENGVPGVGTRDEPLRTSAWEAMRVVEARGVLNISLGGEVRSGSSYPDPV